MPRPTCSCNAPAVSGCCGFPMRSPNEDDICRASGCLEHAVATCEECGTEWTDDPSPLALTAARRLVSRFDLGDRPADDVAPAEMWPRDVYLEGPALFCANEPEPLQYAPEDAGDDDFRHGQSRTTHPSR